VLLWAALIFFLSSQSHLPHPPPGITDKHEHLVAYGILATALAWALTDRELRRISWATVLVVIVACALYGASDEFHQSFVPNRDVSGLDLAADTAGAAIAAIGLRAWAIIRARR
jgi:VanZ family protein